jgi:hypothetical protein
MMIEKAAQPLIEMFMRGTSAKTKKKPGLL